MLISALAKALCLTLPFGKRLISFEEIHKHWKQCTPNQMALLKLLIELYRLFNCKDQAMNWTRLVTQIVVGGWLTFLYALVKTTIKLASISGA